MARKVRNDFRSLPREVYKTWVEGEHAGMSSTQLLNHLKRKGIKPVTPIKNLRTLTKEASQRSGIPINITKDMGSKNKAGGVAGRRISDKEVVVRIHPIMQYRTIKTISDIIDHELDHATILKRQKP